MIDNLIFRSSSVGGLCGKAGLGATGEKLAIKTYLQKRYGRYKEITNKYLEKGIACEDAGIKTYNNLFNTDYVKNDTRVYNDFITGECDIDTGESIIDIKNSWDLFTFHESKTSDNKLYDWQGQCYMELYDRPTFQLVYVLEDAPDLNIFKEINYAGDIEEWEEVQIIANMVYSQSTFDRLIETQGLGGDVKTDKAIKSFIEIPASERLHAKQFSRDSAKYEFIKTRINEARKFLKSIYE
jgi:hypothetical protein